MIVFVRSAFWALFFSLTLIASAWSADRLRQGELVIATPSGARHTFIVDYAISGPERERGLMGRTDLKPDQGMIFDFSTPRPVTMWMKNTPLSLDMLFVDGNGVITGIAASTKPYSLDLIDSPGPVRYVIEINGGRAAALGIGPGGRVVSGLSAP